jgi:2-keto-4-pentenoate hydratase
MTINPLLLEADPRLKHAADALWSAWSSGTLTAPVRELMDGMLDVRLAYVIQEINTKRSVEKGRKLVGRKIGLTSLAMQEKLRVREPNYGMLFADMDRTTIHLIPYGTLVQPKIEAEVALVMRVPVLDRTITEGEFAKCVDHACAAFEIVDSRTKGWDNTLFDAISDNVSASMFVLGEEKCSLDELDLVDCRMVMTCNDAQVSTGRGKNCYGNPLRAATWLAQRMVEVERPLNTGDIILTGALGPIVPVGPDECFAATIEGLGRVATRFW